MQNLLTFPWRRRRLLLAALLLGFVALNILAYIHAYRMTHFVAGVSHPGKPESMSFGQKLNALILGIEVPRPKCSQTPADFDLSFESITIPGRDGNSLAAWLVPHPEAKGLVVLFHGYAACKSNLLSEAKAFHDLGYSTLLVDFRGSGESTGDVTTVGVFEADDVADVFACVCERFQKKPILFGQSMGAVAILRALAVHGIEPEAIILECPFNRMLATVQNRFAAMGVPSFPCAQLLVFWGGMQNGFNGFHHNPVDYAKEVRCPTLLMIGDGDPRVTVGDVSEVSNCIGKRCELTIFQGIGHESYVHARPRLWIDTVNGFLGSLK
ncbi:MAG: alpha/beta fold hydrolase [Planctomycetes bacterium]|nr:alpha/beta fold hydrolase [Planctomycetota bacterium]